MQQVPFLKQVSSQEHSFVFIPHKSLQDVLEGSIQYQADTKLENITWIIHACPANSISSIPRWTHI